MKLEDDYEKIRKIYSTLANTNRLKIIQYVGVKGKTVSSISKELKMSYKLASLYVNRLDRCGLVRKVRNSDASVSVYSEIQISETGEFKFIK